MDEHHGAPRPPLGSGTYRDLEVTGPDQDIRAGGRPPAGMGSSEAAPGEWDRGTAGSDDFDRRHNARVVALANQKGGVGKTTTTINLGAALAEIGQQILIVDFDPQGGCSLGLGIEPSSLELSVYNALLDRSCQVEDVILKTHVQGVELLPSNIDLAAAELLLVQEVAREQSLMRTLAPLRVRYDFILIDCPPSLGLLTINALTAADGVIVPLECEYYALRGMALLMDSIDRIKERLNPRLQIDGILATMFDNRTLHSREVLERVREAFGHRLFDTTVRKTIRFAEAPVVGEPILSYAPTSAGSESYRSLAKEVMRRVSTREPAGR
ncbi:MAG: ParA family protein [Actinomycetota bacterium]|nr:ParA family protein [Actinomycetota bacterium]